MIDVNFQDMSDFYGAPAEMLHAMAVTRWVEYQESERLKSARLHALIQRCINPSNPLYKYYGMHGVRVEKNIRKRLAPRPYGKYLNRINKNIGYVEGNLEWSHKPDYAFWIKERYPVTERYGV